MINMTLSYTVTAPNKVEYWVDTNPVDQDNPTTLIKKYDDTGSIKSIELYDEDSEMIHDFHFSKNSFSRMTDRVTGKNCKPKNAYEFMGISLVVE